MKRIVLIALLLGLSASLSASFALEQKRKWN